MMMQIPRMQDLAENLRFELLAYVVEERTSHAVEWAVAMLEAGFDTASLRQLASHALDPEYRVIANPWDITDDLNRALMELDYKMPEAPDVYDEYAGLIANRVVTGQIAPLEGLTRLRDLAIASDYDDALMDWYYLESEIELHSDGIKNSPFPEVARTDQLIRKCVEAVRNGEELSFTWKPAKQIISPTNDTDDQKSDQNVILQGLTKPKASGLRRLLQMVRGA